jgi:hypothetical protein
MVAPFHYINVIKALSLFHCMEFHLTLSSLDTKFSLVIFPQLTEILFLSYLLTVVSNLIEWGPLC